MTGLFLKSLYKQVTYKNYLEPFLSIWVFFHEHSRITGLQGNEEGISLTPHYHFDLIHRHLGISQVVTAESSSLHITSSQTRTGNLWFQSASHLQIMYNLIIEGNFSIDYVCT